MRWFCSALILLVVISLSGIPEFSAGLMDDQSAYMSIQDNAEEKSKEDSKEKEELDEKEDVKGLQCTEDVFFIGLHSGPSLEIYNGILRDSGYYPEDHYPPPECA